MCPVFTYNVESLPKKLCLNFWLVVYKAILRTQKQNYLNCTVIIHFY